MPHASPLNSGKNGTFGLPLGVYAPRSARPANFIDTPPLSFTLKITWVHVRGVFPWTAFPFFASARLRLSRGSCHGKKTSNQRTVLQTRSLDYPGDLHPPHHWLGSGDLFRLRRPKRTRR